MKPSFDANVTTGMLMPQREDVPAYFFIKLEASAPFDLDFRTADVTFVESLAADLAEIIATLRSREANRPFDGTDTVARPSEQTVKVTPFGMIPVDSAEESSNPGADAPIEIK